MKRYLFAYLVMLLGVVMIGPSSSFGLTKLEQRFLDSFPASISDWQKVGSYNYEEESPGGGVSIGYNLNDAAATIYLYNMNFKNIPSGIGSKAVKGDYNDSVNAIYEAQKLGFYQTVEKINEGKIKLGHNKKASFLYATFAITKHDVESDSYLYVTALKNHFFKIRVTSAKGTLTEENLKPLLDGATDLVLLL